MTLSTLLPSLAIFLSCWTLALLMVRLTRAIEDPLGYRAWADTPLTISTTVTAALITASLLGV